MVRILVSAQRTSSPHLVFVVSEDWYFVSHRLRLAQAAMARGYRVTLVARFAEHRTVIEAYGVATVPLDIGRSRTNPLAAVTALKALRRVFRQLEPDIAYLVALKPVLLGTLAARLAGVGCRVNALGGLGFLFGDASVRPSQSWLRPTVRLALRLLLGADQTILQNQEDLQQLRALGIDGSRLHLVPGAGVDLQHFEATPEPQADPIVITLVSRMLWEKGIGELVAAARLLRERGLAVAVRLVGRPDPDNPGSIDEEQLHAWSAEGVVAWRGFAADVPRVWAESHIAVLPSYYREGLPKALLEAAASGRPIVTTDLPGCRDAIVDGETGLLVPPRDPEALALALERLVRDPELRRAMGRRAREDAEARFSDVVLNAAILDLCDRCLQRGEPR